jgi:hypothetical protein
MGFHPVTMAGKLVGKRRLYTEGEAIYKTIKNKQYIK